MKQYFVHAVYDDGYKEGEGVEFVSVETAQQACDVWYGAWEDPWTIQQMVELDPPAAAPGIDGGLSIDPIPARPAEVSPDIDTPITGDEIRQMLNRAAKEMHALETGLLTVKPEFEDDADDEDSKATIMRVLYGDNR